MQNVAPKTRELDPFPTSVLVDCLDIVLPTLTQTVHDLLASGFFSNRFTNMLLHLYSPSRSLRSASDARIFRVPRVCRGLLRRDPFSISDLSSGTLFLSLLGMPRHSPLSIQNWKPTSSLLPPDFSLSFFCFHQAHDYYASVFAVCVCVCVWVWVCMGVCAFWNECAYLLL